MADKSIDELNAASELDDTDLLAVFQDGETKKMAGAVLRDYVDDIIDPAVDAATDAKEAAESAKSSTIDYALAASNSANAASGSASAASTSASDADISAKNSQAYATGYRGNTPVTQGDDAYHNNASYYAGQAGTSATAASGSAATAEAWTTGAGTSGEGSGTTPGSKNNAAYYAGQAGLNATSAGTDALKAEGYAVGTQNGTEQQSGTYYHNNAKYYAGEAAVAAATKVNKPVTNPNGMNGQILRSLGTGATEWVDVGLPTDQQTADAIDAWLDAHPEATTTVQDGAISPEKLDGELLDNIHYATLAEIITGEGTDANNNPVRMMCLGEVTVNEPTLFTRGSHGLTTICNSIIHLNTDAWFSVGEVAEEFNSGKSYSAGFHVLHDDKLWRFTEDHPAGVWTDEDVECREFDETVSYSQWESVRYNGIVYRFNTAGGHPAGPWIGTDVNFKQFNESTRYSSGSFAVYENTLYKFTATHSAGAWIGTDVSEVESAGNVILKIPGTAPYTLQIPNFVNCVFDNVYGSRTAIASGLPADFNEGLIVGARFTNCTFKGVDFAKNAAYIQSADFTSCEIRSHTCFEESSGTVQTRFVNCEVGQFSKKLVKCGSIFGYFSGTYQGNYRADPQLDPNFYSIECKNAQIIMEGIYFENIRFLYVVGKFSSGNQLPGSVTFQNCHIGAVVNSDMFIFKTDYPNMLNLNLLGTHFTTSSTNIEDQKFCNKKVSDFASVTGRLIGVPGTPANNFAPFYGDAANVNLKTNIMTMQDIVDNTVTKKRFTTTYSKAQVNDGTALNHTLDVGAYILFLTRRIISGTSVSNHSDPCIYYIDVPYDATVNTNTKVIELRTWESTSIEVTVAATRPEAGSPQCTVSVSLHNPSATAGYIAYLDFLMINGRKRGE